MKSVRLIGFLHPRFIGWLLNSAVGAGLTLLVLHYSCVALQACWCTDSVSFCFSECIAILSLIKPTSGCWWLRSAQSTLTKTSDCAWINEAWTLYLILNNIRVNMFIIRDPTALLGKASHAQDTICRSFYERCSLPQQTSGKSIVSVVCVSNTGSSSGEWWLFPEEC